MKRPHRGEPIDVPTYAAGTSRKPPPANAISVGGGSLPRQQLVNAVSRPPVDGPYEYGNPAHEAIFGVPAERVHEDTRVAWEWVLG
ncbi:hypothetical protein [Streptomyces sp. NPDC016172]|uniref:hypothetical protein n=1 Tax=Streptomyces sp. NPDC016172 TaxID=3364964 RepID=UPI0037023FE1